jgi:hypothetical protein
MDIILAASWPDGASLGPQTPPSAEELDSFPRPVVGVLKFLAESGFLGPNLWEVKDHEMRTFEIRSVTGALSVSRGGGTGAERHQASAPKSDEGGAAEMVQG